MSRTLSIRIPDETAKALERLAGTLDRPKAYVVQKALDSYLAEYADYQIALERLRDKDDEVVSAAELRKRLGGR
jgi:RHH-type transcriptional regulator, rel operon repressor / antitoxin RelB